MIIVTGATGQLGSLVVEQLLARVPVAELGVSVRDPDRARALSARGVRVRRGDFTDAGSLPHAFEGARTVLVISAATTGGDAVQQHRTAIDAAVSAGAERIVYTSHAGARPDSAFPPMPDHAETEQLLSACGVPFTSLRNGFYASFAAQLLSRSGAAQTGELRLPEDGPVAWTTHADLAEAAAVTLTDGALTDRALTDGTLTDGTLTDGALTAGGLEGVTPPLVAPEAVDMDGVAAIASELLGRTVTRVVVPDEEYRADLLQRVPEQAADMLLGLFAAARRGDFAATGPALGTLLGRPPAALRSTLEAAAV